MYKRLGIFVFYNSAGIVECYVETMLESLLGEIDEIVIAVNGNITELSMQKLQKYSKHIFVRENKGYDGGAYKDIFLTYFDRSYLDKWDEIILFNDTFYAPIFPWKPVFDKMETIETDFWGLTAHPGGSTFFGRQEKMPYHIQGYFIVCRKKMFSEPVFFEFWKQLEYPGSYIEAVTNYEIRFTTYMQEAGFQGISYIEACDKEYLLEYDKNPYAEKAKELLVELHMPIIKRKIVNIEYFSSVREVLDFLREQSAYDIKLIEEDIKRMELEEKNIFSAKKIQQFCSEHERIYIYGHGKYGKGVADYLAYKNISYEAFLVSEKKDEEGSNVYTYGEVTINQNDGVILALGRKAIGEVYSNIKNHFEEGQLFLPNY